MITQLQQLEAKKQQVLAKAQVAAELRESVLRSCLLASFTNAMPEGMTIRSLNLTTATVREEPVRQPAQTTKFQSRGMVRNPAPAEEPAHKRVETSTHIDVIGLAKTDVQVAQFISRVSANPLVQAVELEYSEQTQYLEVTVRQFKVNVALKPGVRMENEAEKASDDGPLADDTSAPKPAGAAAQTPELAHAAIERP